jgi:FkbM family methyltransferase
MNQAQVDQLNNLLKHEASLPVCVTNVLGKKLRLATPNPKCFSFAQTVLSREPETTDWIRKMPPESVFFDIGANNAIYALLASLLNQTYSYAFEPHFASYYICQQNIYLNQLEDHVKVFPLAVADQTSLSNLFLSSKTAGKSLNNYGESRPSEDPLWNAVFPQGSVAMSIEEICMHLSIVPDYIKVDVDGLEASIVKGATKTLDDSRLKGMMIEFNSANKDDVQAARTMRKFGFNLERRAHCGYFFRRH